MFTLPCNEGLPLPHFIDICMKKGLLTLMGFVCFATTMLGQGNGVDYKRTYISANLGHPIAIPTDDEKAKIPAKGNADKFLYISKVSVDFQKDDGMGMYYVFVSKANRDVKIETQLDEAEKKGDDRNNQSKKPADKNVHEKLDKDGGSVKEEYTNLGHKLAVALKEAGHIDTVNRVFQDENNTLVLEAKVYKLNVFAISGFKDNPCCATCFKAKVYLWWYLENRYGEVLDSVKVTGISENIFRDFNDYGFVSLSQSGLDKMAQTGIEASFGNLYQSAAYRKYSKSEAVAASSDPILHLNKPNTIVGDKEDAADAAVIIKREDKGHGSGFAVSQDGYVLTNYHVIATDNPTKTVKVKVLLQNGDEVPATVVRYSKTHDLALLKIEKTFEKAFVIGTEKLFKNLMDVYTIGAPKSIELGQTITPGIISNERKTNNNNLIQLSMAVNSGNSGGPLFDKSGTLHGVIVAKLVGESTEGISFAIPAYRIGEYLNIAY